VIGNKKEIEKAPDLFSNNKINTTNSAVQYLTKKLIENYAIYANDNYSGVEFGLPENRNKIESDESVMVVETACARCSTCL
jgi:hypothetical protein